MKSNTCARIEARIACKVAGDKGSRREAHALALVECNDARLCLLARRSVRFQFLQAFIADKDMGSIDVEAVYEELLAHVTFWDVESSQIYLPMILSGWIRTKARSATSRSPSASFARCTQPRRKRNFSKNRSLQAWASATDLPFLNDGACLNACLQLRTKRGCSPSSSSAILQHLLFPLSSSLPLPSFRTIRTS